MKKTILILFALLVVTTGSAFGVGKTHQTTIAGKQATATVTVEKSSSANSTDLSHQTTITTGNGNYQASGNTEVQKTSSGTNITHSSEASTGEGVVYKTSETTITSQGVNREVSKSVSH